MQRSPRTPGTDPRADDMQGVHVVTRVQSVLGAVDHEGNVRHQRSFELEIQALTEEAFVEAYRTLAKLRDEAAWVRESPVDGAA